MAQRGKQMRVGAREGFYYHSVKLVLLANVNRYEVDSNTFFPSGKAPLSILSIALSQLWPLPWRTFVSVVCEQKGVNVISIF